MSNPNISLNSSPSTISLLDDGIVYIVKAIRDFEGGKAELWLNMSNDPGDYLDRYITISFMGMEIQFYFRLDPDQSGNELSAWTGADTYDQFITKVAEEMSLNYTLFKTHAIIAEYIGGTLKLYFSAKETGTDYNITLKSSDISGVTINTITAGINSTLPDDYRIYFAPFLFENTNDPLGQELIAIDNDKLAIANLKDYLSGELETQFTYPFNGVYARILPNAVKKFYINYAEYENGNVQLLHTTYDNPKYVISGGLIRIDADFFSAESGNYFEYANNIQRFLNWAPLEKITYPDIPERLYFLKSTSGIITVKLQVKKFELTATTTDLLSTATNPDNPYCIIELAVGTQELFLNSGGSDVEWYKIWIEDSNNDPISEIRSFVVDHTEYINKRILFFKNSFDVYETVCCTGELTTDDLFAREEIEVRKGPKFHRAIKETSWTKAYTLSTGWLPGKEYRNWLTEVLLSKDTFLALGHFLLPVIINNKKAWREKSREHLYSLKFEFEADFNESRYSSIIGDGAYFLLQEDGIVLLDENDIGLIAS